MDCHHKGIRVYQLVWGSKVIKEVKGGGERRKGVGEEEEKEKREGGEDRKQKPVTFLYSL